MPANVDDRHQGISLGFGTKSFIRSHTKSQVQITTSLACIWPRARFIIYHSRYFQLHYSNKYHVFSAQRALCSWSWGQNLSYSVCVNKENTQICCHVALVQAEQTVTGPPKTVGAAWKAQELVCSSGGATGLHLWHDQFCSLHRALIDEALFVLILISFFIFIMAETALGKRRPWWTN